jgi:hypothetical protein
MESLRQRCETLSEKLLKQKRKKKDWGCGSSGRKPALQAWGPEFNSIATKNKIYIV